MEYMLAARGVNRSATSPSRVKCESESRENFAGFSGVPIQNAVDTEFGGNLTKKRTILDISDILRRHMSNIEREAIDIEVGLPDMHERGDDEEIDEILEVKPGDPVLGNFATLVAHDRDFQPVNNFEPVNEIDRILEWLRLFEDVVCHIRRREVPRLIKNNLPQVGLERHFSFFVDVVADSVAVIQFRVVHVKMLGRLLAERRIPAVGQEDATDVEKEGRDV